MTEVRTRSHLAKAQANRVYAMNALGDEKSSQTTMNWAGVAAFYSAMHYINGYLWETARLEPSSHRDRENIISRWPVLAPLSHVFKQMLANSVLIRYDAGYQISRADLSSMIQHNLTRIAQVVERELQDEE